MYMYTSTSCIKLLDATTLKRFSLAANVEGGCNPGLPLFLASARRSVKAGVMRGWRKQRKKIGRAAVPAQQECLLVDIEVDDLQQRNRFVNILYL